MSVSRGLTVREIAGRQGLTIHTVLFHRGREPELWRTWEVGERKQPGRRGRPEKEYDPVKVADHYAAKVQAAGQGRPGPKRRPGTYPPNEVVGWRTIAERLDINYDTVRGYPSRYTRGNNPFPPQVAAGRFLWGDVEAWDDRRGRSGRWGPRTIPGGVPAAAARERIRELNRAGLTHARIARESGVPARTVHRLATGELAMIAPVHEAAVLGVQPPARPNVL